MCSLGRYVCMFAGYHTHLLTHLCVGKVCVCKDTEKDEKAAESISGVVDRGWTVLPPGGLAKAY